MNFKCGFLIIFFCLVFVCPASAEEDKWSWVEASSNSNHWNVRKGWGELHINGNKFTAELYEVDDDNYLRGGENYLRFKMKGTIEGNKVNAKVTTQNSDYQMGTPYTGYYSKKEWKGFEDTKGRKAITLTDGWNFIGLTKEIMKK